MMRVSVAALVPLLALGCEAPPDVEAPLDQRVEIPAAPAAGEGFQIVGPELTIPAGADQMLCWVPEAPAEDADHLIATFRSFQGASGHHLVAMKSIIPRQPGEVFDCTLIENMASVRPLITPNTANAEGTVNLLTDDFAIRLPGGEQIVMQSHYVNVNTQDILVRDVANFEFLPPGEERIEANYMVINNDSFAVPANNELHTQSTDCVMERPLQFAAVMGHMHEWGKRVSVEKTTAAGTTTVYDVPDWSAEYRDAPPITHYPLEEPFSVEAGDSLRVTCEWVNDTSEPLGFPNEMCVAMFVYYPALPEGFLICGDG